MNCTKCNAQANFNSEIGNYFCNNCNLEVKVNYGNEKSVRSIIGDGNKWKEIARKAKVYDLRRMEAENLMATPIGLIPVDLCDFMVASRFFEQAEVENKFVWRSVEDEQRFRVAAREYKFNEYDRRKVDDVDRAVSLKNRRACLTIKRYVTPADKARIHSLIYTNDELLKAEILFK